MYSHPDTKSSYLTGPNGARSEDLDILKELVKTRYGSSLRKIVKKMEVSQHKKYQSPFCGATSLKRTAVGVWTCARTNKKMAGGAWEPHTQNFQVVSMGIRRLREAVES